MAEKNNQKIRVSYESEADVLSWEVSDQPIDHAEEMGNVVVHFSGEHVPVLIELLEASKFFAEAKRLIEQKSSKTMAPA